mmetsp:Transcript_45614/g.105355  ORF Transcript_45614/g.105355 Transcript_45614/m.105355 type:complete len:211 (+) Transcript_45614:530-1162(+)
MEDLDELPVVGVLQFRICFNPQAVEKDVGLVEANEGTDKGFRPVQLVEPAIHHLHDTQGPTKAPLCLYVLLGLDQQVTDGARVWHKDNLAPNLADAVVVEPHAQRAGVALCGLAAEPRWQLQGVQRQGPLRRRQIGRRTLQVLQSGRFAPQSVRVQRLLASGAGRGVEEPELRFADPEGPGYCAGDVVQLPPQVHLQILLLRRLELCRAQ